MKQLLNSCIQYFSEVRIMSCHSTESIIKNNDLNNYVTDGKPGSEPFIIKLFQTGFKICDRLSPTLSGRIACRLWMTPPHFKTPASERQALESATMETVKVGDNDITTYSWGQSGPTVLLIHGWSGRGTQLGSFVEPLISAGYHVLSFDAPAHGKSSGKQTNLYEISNTILALQLRYGKFDAVISHSFGNPCTALAIRRGLKARRLVSISPPATMTGLIDKFTQALHIPQKTRDKLTQQLEKKFGGHIWQELSMINSVKEISIPGLVIHDVHDTDVSWEEGQAVAQAWNNAPFMITTGLGHRRILRDNEVIESAIAFINK